ncbi:MAG: molybdate ABC transporter permease subunit [Bacteroidota bacterium]
MIDWQPLLLTLQLALVTTVILFILALPLAHLLANLKSKIKPVFEALISMPLVLPPTVIGFYLLVAFSPTSGIGEWLNTNLNIQLAFTFEGLVLASMIYSLPFMVQPLQNGYNKVPRSLIEAAQTMGKNRWEIFTKVQMPIMKSAVTTAIVLSFAHTIGEFGVVLMIGGNIPGETRVASIAIYDQVEAMNYHAANTYSIILITLSFVILALLYVFNGNSATNIS